MADVKILTIEDSPNLLTVRKDNFRKEGYDISTATGGTETTETALYLFPNSRDKPNEDYITGRFG